MSGHTKRSQSSSLKTSTIHSIDSFSFHELCAPPTLGRSNRAGGGAGGDGLLLSEEESEFYFSARDFVTRRVGNLADTYDIGDKLGAGGYGEVYSCTHKETKIERAVKIMKRSPDREECNDSIEKEFNILKELDHPNILRQIEMFTDDKHYYIVTEICRGGELLEEIQAWGNFIEEDAAELMRHLLSAVNYCHKQGVAHRDLKPENILLEENKELDSIKVIDFGLAQFVQRDTVMHDVAGSIYYIAPEVLEGSHTLKADIWSCGVIAYILMAGYAPFDGHSDEEIKEEILSGEFEFDDDVWDSISDQAKDFIITLLEYDESERPTAEQCLQHPWIVGQRLAVAERLQKRASVNQRAMEALYNLERFNAQSKLKQATCAFIASQLVLKEEKRRIDELFRALDINSNGKLSKEDVCTGYKEIFGKQLEKDMVERMFHRIDVDHTGFIEYSEFVIATMNEKDLLSNQKLKHAFNMFDADGSGYISKDELVDVLSFFQTVDSTLDGGVITRIINQVDEDDDGEIDYNEFCHMMLKTAEDACEEEEEKSKSKSIPKSQEVDTAATTDGLVEEMAPSNNDTSMPQLEDYTSEEISETNTSKDFLHTVASALPSAASLSPVPTVKSISNASVQSVRSISANSVKSVKSISSNSVKSVKSISSTSVKSVKSAITSVKSTLAAGSGHHRKKDSLGGGSGNKRNSGSVKACLALFESTIADNAVHGFDSQLFRRPKSWGNNPLEKFTARLSFGKTSRDSQVIRKVPTPVNNNNASSTLKGGSHHSSKSNGSAGSRTSIRRPTTTAKSRPVTAQS